MGRGSRSAQVLALEPAPPTPTQVWLDALIKVEQENFHVVGQSGCDISPPYGTPRFVVMDETDADNVSELHAFHYCATPEDLLSTLLPLMRTLFSESMDVLEYVNGEFVVLDDASSQSITGDLKCAATLCIRQPAAPASTYAQVEVRGKHALAITKRLRLPGLTAYYGEERFLLTTLFDTAEIELQLVSSFEELVVQIGALALNSTAFLALYDLDAGTKAVPVKLGLRYTTADGTTCGVFEKP